MSSVFDRELDKLRQELYGMCGMVVTAIDRAVQAFLNRDKDLSQEIIAADDAIDRRENTVDEHTLRILALQQPYGRDFRVLISATKATHSLERMGDHAKNLCKCVIHLDGAEGYVIPEAVRIMARLVPEMVHGAVRAMQYGDLELAQQTRKTDKQVNAAYDETLKSFAEHLQQKPQHALTILRLGEAMKHLERCGDLAKNICKDVVYQVQGEIIRHGGKTDASA